MRILKLAMIGFGNAGRAFAKIALEKQEEMKKVLGCELRVTAIATASRGNLVDENGIDLRKAVEDIELNGHFDEKCKSYSSLGSEEIINNADYDVLMEITPLNIFTGQPAIDNIRAAFTRKKHVITANKGPIAWVHRELKNYAHRQGVLFLHETTVMDGTPVFNLVEETLPLCKIRGFKGILNTTTNFVLEEMAKGEGFDEAVMEGKRRGFVEADPSLDIEGFDAAAKTAALINVLMDGNITPLDIKREGIQNIRREDILEAEANDKVIKLVCKGYLDKDKAVGEVKPVYIDKSHVFASVTGTSSILSINTDLMGEVTIIEHEPEIQQTGYGLFSDLLRLIKTLCEKI